ncbi:MAG: formate--tetrahydrofolate ligase [Alphaproteobacteria bacterium]|nr:formate--tetrahydrofolate ligase [Alphaproteobacteria bacterium]MBV9693733.1 formate--tetrahydrofolate ligase [Alphaproteobacteria bacterium]
MTDLEIARGAKLEPIEAVGARAGLPAEALYRYGPHKAKVSLDFIAGLGERPPGKLVLVTAINPTAAGEGKTTTTVGLADALSAIGKRAMICLREPSLGPCFGMKGGAAGGGYAQVVPMDEINLHFTGDFHAITAANNLLAALIDNQVYWGNPLRIDPSKISWRRVMDMNDRALRHIVVGLDNNGQVREDGFDITVASEVMAIFCLAASLAELEERIDRIVVARDFAKKNVTARQIQASGAMGVLLRDAMQPNLVQTLEHTPAFVHGGPFANIAHGCNSVIATRTALELADYVVTEAGFGADLGAEKFFDIKCRQAGLTPAAAVIVATVRALKMHGGVDKKDLGAENVAAVKAGMANLLRHIENVRKFGVPVTVAINHFTADSDRECQAIVEGCRQVGVRAHLCRHWAEGSKGAVGLAEEIVALAGKGSDFRPLYPDDMPLTDKIATVAREIYRAADISLSPDAAKKLKQYEADGFGKLPVCMAKTQYSFTAEPDIRGAPSGFILPVRDVRLSAGAGFVVALCGDLMTMPGLPRDPAAYRIRINAEGQIEGLF